MIDVATRMGAAVKGYVDRRLTELKEALSGEIKAVVPKDGKDGKDGIDGVKGADGQDGRDALSIEILPGVTPGKSYHRGTFAAYKGGLIRASRNTDAANDGDVLKCGWVVVVNGIESLQFIQDINDPRAIKFLAETTEKQVVWEARVPTMDYKGVFVEGEFRQGDSVTFGGSLWVAQKDGPSGRPGEPDSDGWKLAVKKGRDGKDGRNGIDMTKPIKVTP